MTVEETSEIAVNFRGNILGLQINLERTIDFYLAQYFTTSSEKETELILLILGNERISFSNKRDVLQYLSKEKKINILSEYPTFFKDLETIIVTRNIVAHYFWTFDEKSKQMPYGSIQFLKLKNKLERITYEHEDMKKIYEKIQSLTQYLDGKLIHRPS